jgi:hypothetical protein
MIIIGNKFNRNIYNSAREAYNLFGNYLAGQDQQNDEEDNTETSVVETTKKLETPAKKTKSSKTGR